MSDIDKYTEITRAQELIALRARVSQLEEEQAKRLKAERELQESEARYRVLVETMSDGLEVQDKRGAVVYANERLSKMLGYTRHEMVGRLAVDFVDEADRTIFDTEMRRQAEGERGPYEIVLRSKDGRNVSTLMSPMAIWGHDHEFRGSFAVFTDITDRKKVEQALEIERNLLRTLMDSIPDYTYIKDTQGRFVTTNTAHLKILGVSSLADVVGKTDFDFFPRDLAEQYFAMEQAVMSSGQPGSNRVEKVLTPSGQLIWVMTFKAPLHNPGGEVVGLVGVSRDITQLRLAEHALRESEERFRLIIENSIDVAYKLNLGTLSFEYMSPSVQRWSGFTAAEVMAFGPRGCLVRIHPEDRKRVLDHFRALHRSSGAAGNERAPTVIEYRTMRKGGEYCWISHTATAVCTEDGRAIAEVGSVRDITESRHAEEAYRAASRMEATTTLAGGIAHDFNNLMVGVMGNAELLQARFSDSPDVIRMLDTIAGSAQRAGELAQQMLAFARGGKYQPRLMNLNEAVTDVLRLEEGSLPPRIRIERTLEPTLWTINADRVQIGQVVLNLCMNAVEAIEDAGRIAILTRNVVVDAGFARKHRGLKPAAYVCLTVEDTGKGMAEDMLAHVFEPFFTTKAQGRGLGLAAVYGIVKNHEGYIAVTSEIGLGTTFTVYLPAVEAEAVAVQKPAPPSPEPPPQSPPKEATILVIDDEPLVLDVIQRILDNLGYRVLVARNGREAVDIAESYEGEIHIALLDMGMPVMGGAQAFPLLMKARPALKVLIASGFELDPAAQSLLDAGAKAFIQKPFRAKVLIDHIHQALAGTAE